MNRRRNAAKKRKYSPENIVSQSSLTVSRLKTNLKAKKRKDNSLIELTKNFLEYIKAEAEESNIIQINKLEKKLKVKKRRIYDITNVLEGIGYIKKRAKNEIVWLDNKRNIEDIHSNSNIKEINSDVKKKQNELEDLDKQERDLDIWLNEMKNSVAKMVEDKSFKENAYITYDDLKMISSEDDVNLIAVKAKKGTSIEIPEPENVEKIYDQTNNVFNTIKLEYEQRDREIR